MRAFLLVMLGAAPAAMLLGIIGGGGSGGKSEDELNDRVFADRIGMGGNAPVARPMPLAAPTRAVVEAPTPPRKASTAASPWSAPAEFAPVDPVR
jgi:hypothetical protein